MSVLEVSDLTAGYGEIVVLREVSFVVDKGKVAAILGPNGAGKTTTLRAVSGLVKARGRVTFCGSPIAGKSPERIARMGVAHVPEGRGTFSDLTTYENLLVGGYRRRDQDGVKRDLERCFEYFPRLCDRRTERAGNLSGGEQQMLAVARALMLRPQLLLLDEPSLGLAPVVTRELYKILREIVEDQATTVLLVEQNAQLALELADHAYVLEAGSVVLSGDAEHIRQEDAIQHAYLGH